MASAKDPDTVARRSAAAMWQGDAASQWFGFSLESVGPGTASVAVTIAPHHLNGHGICHGGVIFSLADTAFAFACNSYNRTTVAQRAGVDFLKPGEPGRRLTATACEVALTGRSGLYDVVVVDDLGAVIAQFRGNSRTISGTLYDEEATP